MRILGISAYYHDSAAALVIDGAIISAAQEERFTRIKHDSSFPHQSIAFCLKFAGISAQEVDHVVFYDKPLLKFERLLETYLAFAPHGFASFRSALPIWIKEKLFQKRTILSELKSISAHIEWESRLLFSEHHLSHAASAYYPSPFDSAAVLTMDGVGEWATTSMAIGKGRSLRVLKEISFPHSLGLLYSAFTFYTGFKVNSGEYKMMGLAPYGKPRFASLIKEKLIDIKEDGSFRLNLEYFDYCTGLKMTNKRFAGLFGGIPREPSAQITQREMDLAASIQSVTEEIVIKLAKGIAKDTGEKNLCLAGGVALNCVVNGKLRKANLFENIWIQPAAGDSGGALGAALVASNLLAPSTNLRSANPGDSMQGALLGPQYTHDEVVECLSKLGAKFEVLSSTQLIERCVSILVEGKALGWHQGRMEFGPRALGARSILGDPRSPNMQKLLNLKVKFRESFRPFAPSILREDVSNWFDIEGDSPYMLIVQEILERHKISLQKDEESLFGLDRLNLLRSSIPAVTHVDGSARVQTVHESTNPRFHSLISKFKSLTGCPILVNTSFNVRGEPIVCSPEDSYGCFMGTDIDALAIENCYLIKEEQPSHLVKLYEGQFPLD